MMKNVGLALLLFCCVRLFLYVSLELLSTSDQLYYYLNADVMEELQSFNNEIIIFVTFF